MKDRIIEGYLKDFCASNDLGSLDQAHAFEHFVNFCVVSREHPENFEFEVVSVGGPGDFSIDGIAILVNDHIVNSKEEIDFFKRTRRRLDVRFLFIQAKTSDKFEMGDIGNFLFGVRMFFSKQAGPPPNQQVARLRNLVEYIYDSSIDMDRAPVCELYYASTGLWLNDAMILERVKTETTALESTSLFSAVMFRPLDAESIKTLYRELRRKVTREISFEKHTILPAIQDVDEAYIGIIPCSEYLKLICDAEGKLQRALFYDNVRDFQGNNPVNQEIETTLKEAEERDKFVLLNNGITIVAESIGKIGSKFTLRDFQIVNGCQTSHVLFRNQASLQNAYVPIKLIVTGNQDVTSSITKGTNRQTEVKIEAFESLNPFQKELEEFYATFGKDRPLKLYYERRSRQYDALPILPSQIISIPAQVKSFVGMFLNEPHSTHRYYGELLDSNRSKIFISNHSPFPYFLSGYALVFVTAMLSRGQIESRLRPYRYHLLLLFRLLYEPSALPYLNEKRKMDNYCSALFQILSNDTEGKAALLRCADLLARTLSGSSYRSEDSSPDRLRVFTADLMKSMEREPHKARTAASGISVARVERRNGRVKVFSDVKGFGFIEVSAGADIFVHYNDIRSDGYRTLRPGQRVEFTEVDRGRGPAAEEVDILD